METIFTSRPRVSYEFEVEKIIGISSDGNYQVQWAPAWVSKFHLIGCEHLIQEFLQEEQEKIAANVDDGIMPYTGGETSQISEGFSGEMVNASNAVTSVQPTLLKHEVEDSTTSLYSYASEDDADATETDDAVSLIDESTPRNQHISHHSKKAQTESVENDNDGAPLHGNTISDESLVSALVSKVQSILDPGSGSGSITNVRTLKSVNLQNISETGVCSADDEDETMADSHVPETEIGCISSSTHDPKEAQNSMQSQTPNERQFVCPHCSKHYSSNGTLVRHIRNVHTDIRPYSCDQCEYATAVKFSLVQHMRIHTGERPFSCEICGKTFNVRGNWKAHIRTHKKD